MATDPAGVVLARQPMVSPELWRALALLPPSERQSSAYRYEPFLVNLCGGPHNGEVRRRLGAALFADPSLVAACVRSVRRR